MPHSALKRDDGSDGRRGGRAAPMAPGLSAADFGAVGDGAADSTAAIQKAIDTAANNPTRGRILFPAGRGCHVISAPLQLRAGGLRLEGESASMGNQGTCVTAAGFASPMIHASAPAIAILSPPRKRILVLNGEVEPETTPWSTDREHVVTLP